MRGKDYGVSLAQEVEGARPRYGYLRRGASSVGRWSCREFESEFYVQTYQEHGAWRLALRVGRRAEKIEAEGNSTRALRRTERHSAAAWQLRVELVDYLGDRKSTRLNSSHLG